MISLIELYYLSINNYIILYCLYYRSKALAKVRSINTNPKTLRPKALGKPEGGDGKAKLRWGGESLERKMNAYWYFGSNFGSNDLQVLEYILKRYEISPLKYNVM